MKPSVSSSSVAAWTAACFSVERALRALSDSSRPASWVASDFSVERAIRAISESSRHCDGLAFVMDWARRQVVYVSGSPEKFFGVSREEFCKDPTACLRSLTDYDRAALLGLNQEVKRQRRVIKVVQAQGQDGVLRTLRCSAQLVEIDGRTLLCGSALSLDHADEVTSAFIGRRELDTAREALAVTDAEGILAYLNPEQVALFGYDEATELLGRSWRSLYPPDTVHLIETVAFPALSARGAWRGRLVGNRRDGSRFDGDLSLSRLPGGGIVWNGGSASEERSAAERLIHSEALFWAFLNAVDTGVLIRPVGGAYEFVNTVAANWFGLDSVDPTRPVTGGKQLIDDPIFAAWEESDRKVTSTRERVIFDFPFERGGKKWIFEMQMTPLFLINGELSHLCALARDVTQQRLLERQAEAVVRRNMEYGEMQREFISMVSHEFRTPLTSIQGVHYLLSKKVAQLPVEQANGMEKLLGLQSEALRNLKELVDQVLLLNRLEHAAPGEPLPQVGVADFFSKLIEGLNVSVAHQRIVLELELPESFTAGFDVAKMRAACENLIANGLKYSAEDTKVRVKVRLAPQGWGFSVADCGRGIPEADQAKLFQPFHRASNVQGVAGTGLGLAIVRRVVDHHGGSISFTTTLGKGSEFLLVFPSPQSPAPDSVAISPVLESGAPNLPIATTRFPF